LDLTPLPLNSSSSQGAEDFAVHIENLHAEVRRKLVIAAATYKLHADIHRRNVVFEVGDFVLVRLRPKRFPRGAFHKLHHCWAGPFQVLKRLGPNAYHLALPNSLSINPVFNIEDLTAYPGNPEEPLALASDTGPLSILLALAPPRDQIDAILDDQLVSTCRGGYQKFLVRWKNRPSSDNSWIKTEEVQRLAPNLYDEYMAQSLVGVEFSSERGGLMVDHLGPRGLAE
jgi:hypothetical protein